MARRIARLLVAGLLALAVPGLAVADATPIQIVLTYVPGVSNTDTPSASGVAEVVLLEGEARLAATGLPRLDPPQHYEAWLVNPDSNDVFRLGGFNTAQSTSNGRLTAVLPDAIPDKHWSVLLVTIEDTDAPAQPSDRHSIAGTFPPAGSDTLPAILPNTGGDDGGLGVVERASGAGEPDWRFKAGLPALTLVLGAGAGFTVGRRSRPNPQPPTSNPQPH